MAEMSRSPQKPLRQPTHPAHPRSQRMTSSPSASSPTKPATSPGAATERLAATAATPTRSPSRGWTELHLAAARGELDGVRMHFENAKAAGVVSTAINARDKVLGYTPLHYASYWGHPKVVSFLVGAGADVNLTDNTGGSTPLHLAALCGHVEAVSMLLSAGALVDAKNNDGKTPVDFAATPEVRAALSGATKEASPERGGGAERGSAEKASTSKAHSGTAPTSKLNHLQEEVAGLRSQLRHAMFSGSIREDMERLRTSLVQDRDALQQNRGKSTQLSLDDIISKYCQRISEIEYVVAKYGDALKHRDSSSEALQAQLDEQNRSHAEETSKLRDALLDAEQARVAMQSRLRKLQKERGNADVIDTTPAKGNQASPPAPGSALVKSASKQQQGDIHVNPEFAGAAGDDMYWRMRQGATPDANTAAARSVVTTRTPSAKKETNGLVGLRLQRNADGDLFISEITPGGAAASAGNIAVNDLVLAVDGQACQRSDPEDAKQLIAGPPGGMVELALKRKSQTFTAKIVRKAPLLALPAPASADKTRRALTTPSPARKPMAKSVGASPFSSMRGF